MVLHGENKVNLEQSIIINNNVNEIMFIHPKRNKMEDFSLTKII